MRDPARILVVDDMPDNVEILEMRLKSQGYEVITASNGEQALAQARVLTPDLMLLDVMMPGIDGFEVARRLKGDPTLPFMPIILVTAKGETKDVVTGLEAGGDDYLTKPVDHAALMARVRAMLRIKALHDQVETQKAELALWNSSLEERVQAQIGEIERSHRLRRFLPAQIADLVLAPGGAKILESHRRDIVVLFCDLRGFTAFAETGEPEDVMALLRDYHQAVGPLINQYEGTLDRFAGDGLLVFFNDPLPCPDPALRAVKLAAAMRDSVSQLALSWRRRGSEIGVGIGIAQGFATLGQVGFAERMDYSAIGTVTNLAARLCAEARDGQILVSQRIAIEVEPAATLEAMGDLTLKGISRPVAATNIVALKF